MNNQKQDDEKYKKFQCKICLDLATEPIITPCGHLYCWQCIYTWAQKKNPLQCPYCSNIFELDKITTIFTGDSKESNQSEIPKRPTNPRQQQPNQQQQQQFGNFQFGFSFGLPFMMMSNFNFGQGQQTTNSRNFMLVFFLGFLIINILPYLMSYFQETSPQRQRRSRRQQDTSEDYFSSVGLGLVIILGFAGLNYLVKKILNK